MACNSFEFESDAFDALDALDDKPTTCANRSCTSRNSVASMSNVTSTQVARAEEMSEGEIHCLRRRPQNIPRANDCA